MAIVKCKECKQDVSDTAAKCPHCGVSKPAKITLSDKLREQEKDPAATKKNIIGCLTMLVLLLVLVGISKQCSDESETSSGSKTTTLLWYEGGDLHKSGVGEWVNASSKNKLATAADWAAAFFENKTLVERGGLDYLRVKASELVVCVDESVSGSVDALKNSKTSGVAVLCITLMEWRK